MSWKRIAGIAFGAALVGAITIVSQQRTEAQDSKDPAGTGLPSGIVWYGRLEDGLNAAKISGRPILLLSAAPQCAGVPGMW